MSTTTESTRRVELACDSPEPEQFAEFLRNLGHDVTIGRSTGNYVDGEWTSTNLDARAWLNAQWIAYCNA